MKKFISMLCLALGATLASAAPALADTWTTTRIAAVTVSEEKIAMPGLSNVAGSDCSKADDGGKGQACFLTFEANPGFFAGKQLCVSGQVDEWAVTRDGAIINDGPRRAICSPINPDGSSSVSVDFRNDGVPFIAEGGRIIAWASREDVVKR